MALNKALLWLIANVEEITRPPRLLAFDTFAACSIISFCASGITVGPVALSLTSRWLIDSRREMRS